MTSLAGMHPICLACALRDSAKAPKTAPYRAPVERVYGGADYIAERAIANMKMLGAYEFIEMRRSRISRSLMLAFQGFIPSSDGALGGVVLLITGADMALGDVEELCAAKARSADAAYRLKPWPAHPNTCPTCRRDYKEMRPDERVIGSAGQLWCAADYAAKFGLPH